MKRYVIQVSSKYTTKSGEERWRNCNVGSAFERDNGEWSLTIDPGVSISSVEGVRITLREPFDRDAPRRGGGNGQRGGQHQAPQTSGGYDGGGGFQDDDQIPF